MLFSDSPYFLRFWILNNKLMFPDGTEFYPDIKNGLHGFNTDPQRGADTFFPFKQLHHGKVYIQANNQTTVNNYFTAEIDDISIIAIYNDLRTTALGIYVKGVGNINPNVSISVNGKNITIANRVSSGTYDIYYM